MPHRNRRTPVPKRVAALLEAARTRSDWKRLGAWLDDEGRELRAPLLAEARRRGAELPDEALCWQGKKLIRRARGAEDEARQRRNPIRIDEPFECAHCGLAVPPGLSRVRDHCPSCLRSLHVDVVPGDRAAGCGGLMDPVGVELGGRAEVTIRYRCRRCGYEHRNRAGLDVVPPDDAEALRRLAALGERWEEDLPPGPVEG
jgi:predicted RNA-binding Zn-ribbon protein involved in translation (DUF1610 family)